VAAITIAAFGVGRYLRPAPPPLIIERAANSSLPDSAVSPANQPLRKSKLDRDANASSSGAQSADGNIYICGARTKKGTPCHRRVPSAGERCFQHKGMPAILPIDKLTIAAPGSTKD
jgi:hypothetical protein